MEYQRGDKITCIDTMLYEDKITLGKQYDILNYSSCIKCVWIMCDNGKREWIGENRFKK